MGITAHASNVDEEQTSCFFDASLKVNGHTYYLRCENQTHPKMDPSAGGQPSLETLELNQSSDSSVIVLGSEQHQFLLTQSILELSQLIHDSNVSSFSLIQYCDDLHQRLNELCFLRTQYVHTQSLAVTLPPTVASASSSSSSTQLNPTMQPSLNSTLEKSTSTIPPHFESNTFCLPTTSPPLQFHVDKDGIVDPLRMIELNYQEQLIRRPQVRQYMLNGILHRSVTKLNVPWLELFHDLLFVGALSSAGHVFEYGYTSKYLGQFTLLFFNIYKAWMNITLYNNQFHHQDMIHKLYTFLHMALLMSMAVNANHSFNQPKTACTVTLFLLSYVGVMYATMLARFVQVYFNPLLKWHLCISIVCQFITSWFYILAALFPFTSFCIPLWITGLILDWISDYISLILVRVFHLSAFLALNIEHVAERFGLWVIICLGEVIVYILFDNDLSYNGLVYLAPILGLVIAFCIQAIYFELEEVAHEKHALRRNLLTSTVWTLLHLPLTWCIVVLGFAMTSHHAILMNDQNEILRETIDAKLMIWTFSGCFVGIFLCFAIISILHLPLRPSSPPLPSTSKSLINVSNPSQPLTLFSSSSSSTTTTTNTTTGTKIQSTWISKLKSKTGWVFLLRCCIAFMAFIIGFVGTSIPPPFATGLAAFLSGIAMVFEFYIQIHVEGKRPKHPNLSHRNSSHPT